MAAGSTSRTNPFAGFSGLATLKCLAEGLPKEFQLAILRQAYVRRLCLDCLLGGAAPIVEQFVSEIDAVMEQDANPSRPRPPKTVKGDATASHSVKFLHGVARSAETTARPSTPGEPEDDMWDTDDEVETGAAFHRQFHELAEALHIDPNEVLSRLRRCDPSFHSSIMEYGRAEDLLLAVSSSEFGNRRVAATLLFDAIKKFDALPEFGHQFLYALSAAQGRKMALALKGTADRRIAIRHLPSVAF